MPNNIMQNWRINRLYDDVNWALTKYHSTKDNIDTFEDISKDILMLLQKEDIRYRDLSIQGLNANHSVNVAILNVKIGKIIGMDNLNDLALGGLLHDIGKLFVPTSILNKPASLTLKEKLQISQHTEIGYNLIKKTNENKNIFNIVREHHHVIKTLQKPVNICDLKNDDIIYPLICGISDIIDAMFSYRSYKKPLNLAEVKEELTNKGIKNIDNLFENIL